MWFPRTIWFLSYLHSFYMIKMLGNSKQLLEQNCACLQFKHQPLQLLNTIRFGCHSLALLSFLICFWCLVCSHMALFCFHCIVTHNQSGVGKGNVLHSVSHKFNHVAWSQASFTQVFKPVESGTGWASHLKAVTSNALSSAFRNAHWVAFDKFQCLNLNSLTSL